EFAVDGGRAARPVAPGVALKGEDGTDLAAPKFRAVLFIDGNKVFVVGKDHSVLHGHVGPDGVNDSLDNRDRRKPQTGVFVGPGELRAFLGPDLLQAFSHGDARPTRAAELGPIVGPRGRGGKQKADKSEQPRCHGYLSSIKKRSGGRTAESWWVEPLHESIRAGEAAAKEIG